MGKVTYAGQELRLPIAPLPSQKLEFYRGSMFRHNGQRLERGVILNGELQQRIDAVKIKLAADVRSMIVECLKAAGSPASG